MQDDDPKPVERESLTLEERAAVDSFTRRVNNFTREMQSLVSRYRIEGVAMVIYSRDHTTNRMIATTEAGENFGRTILAGIHAANVRFTDAMKEAEDADRAAAG